MAPNYLKDELSFTLYFTQTTPGQIPVMTVYFRGLKHRAFSSAVRISGCRGKSPLTVKGEGLALSDAEGRRALCKNSKNWKDGHYQEDVQKKISSFFKAGL